MELPRRLGRIISIFLLVMGIIFLLYPQISLTGATIGIPRATLSWLSGLGLLVIVVSILLLLSLSREQRRSKLEEELLKLTDTREKIKLIEKAYGQGTIDERFAAEKFNECIYLKGMIYKYEKQFTIEGPSARYSLTTVTNPLLAYAVRDRIIANHPSYLKNIQLHISKTESTKHHKKGLK